MATLRAQEVTERQTWDDAINSHGGHPLQLWGWGEVKGHGEWTPRRLRIVDDADQDVGFAQVLVRALPAPLKALCYVPRGPVVAPDGVGDPVMRAGVGEAVVGWCKDTIGGVAVTFEPDWDQETSFDVPGARASTNTILIPSTLILDLTKSDDELMGAMVKKTRQYIRKSQKEDLEYREVTDEAELDQCLAIYRSTAQWAGFGLHPDEYYRLVRTALGEASPIFAAFERSTDGGPFDSAVSFVWFAASATTSFELYGGMTETGQRLRANYALKWHAIQAMRQRGVRRYDVNGLLNDGISTFKRGFADHENELLGTVDVPLNSALYTLWDKGLPTAKKIVRRVRH